MRSKRTTPRLLVGAIIVLVLGGVVAATLARASLVAPAPPSTEPASTGPSLTATSEAADSNNPWLSADGIAYAVHLRKSIGLRSDEDWVRFVATVPGAVDNVVRYSIPMTNAEVLDVGRLTANRDLILADLEQFRTGHVDAWGGYYLDGDVITVMLIDPSGSVERELRGAVPPPLAVKTARWSFQTLTNLSVLVSDDPWLQAHYHVLSAGADVEHNTVALEVSSTDPTAVTTIASHFHLGDELTVTIDGTGQGKGSEPGG